MDKIMTMEDFLKDKWDYQKKCEQFKKSVASKKDREAFAEAFAYPILKTIPNESSVRNIFKTEVLGPNAQAIYPVDQPDTVAWYLPKHGMLPQQIVTGDQVTVATFEIGTSVHWKMQYAREGRFNVALRAQEKFKNALVGLEEDAGWAVITASVPASNVVTVAGSGGTYCSIDLMIAIFDKMEENGMTVTDIYMSPTRYYDFLKWQQDRIDPVTQREILQNRGFSNFWGARIHTLRRLSDNSIYAFDTEYYGVMPIKQELKTYDDPTAIKQFMVGIIGNEEIGFAALDTRAIVRADISSM